MGTGAVYVTMSGIKSHSQALTHVETVFYFINMALFLLNTTTLLLQAICKYLYFKTMHFTNVNRQCIQSKRGDYFKIP